MREVKVHTQSMYNSDVIWALMRLKSNARLFVDKQVQFSLFIEN